MRDSGHKQATTQQAYIFRSYPLEQKDTSNLARNPDEYSKNVEVWQVCRATSAAPCYFKPVKIEGLKYRDGAQWKSNPATEIFNEVTETYRNTSKRSNIKAFVSVGCGRGPKPTKLPGFKQKSNNPLHGTFPWPDSSVVERRLTQKLRDCFLNFAGPQDLFDIEIDEWRNDRDGGSTFDRISHSAAQYCSQKEVKARLEQAAAMLVELRHNRARTTKWERFALGAKYICRQLVPDTSKLERIRAPSTKQVHTDKADTFNAKRCLRIFDDRGSFMDHLSSEHEIPPQDEANWDSILKLLVESMITTMT